LQKEGSGKKKKPPQKERKTIERLLSELKKEGRKKNTKMREKTMEIYFFYKEGEKNQMERKTM
jgi:hypothetical protein